MSMAPTPRQASSPPLDSNYNEIDGEIVEDTYDDENNSATLFGNDEADPKNQSQSEATSACRKTESNSKSKTKTKTNIVDAKSDKRKKKKKKSNLSPAAPAGGGGGGKEIEPCKEAEINGENLSEKEIKKKKKKAVKETEVPEIAEGDNAVEKPKEKRKRKKAYAEKETAEPANQTGETADHHDQGQKDDHGDHMVEKQMEKIKRKKVEKETAEPANQTGETADHRDQGQKDDHGDHMVEKQMEKIKWKKVEKETVEPADQTGETADHDHGQKDDHGDHVVEKQMEKRKRKRKRKKNLVSSANETNEVAQGNGAGDEKKTCEDVPQDNHGMNNNIGDGGGDGDKILQGDEKIEEDYVVMEAFDRYLKSHVVDWRWISGDKILELEKNWVELKVLESKFRSLQADFDAELHRLANETYASYL